MTNPFGILLDEAAVVHCGTGDKGCYSATCPINCLAFLIEQHGLEGNLPLLVGDLLLLEDYVGRRA